MVQGTPPPSVEAGKSPAETGTPNPCTQGQRPPAEPGAERPPAISVPSTGRPSAVGVKIGVPRQVIRRAGVLQRSVRCTGNCVDAAGDPLIEIIVGGETAGVHGRAASLDGERLALSARRG